MTPEQEQHAIMLASEGRSRREIVEELEITPYLFSAHRARNPEYGARFARAEQDGLELLADDLKTVHEKYADVQRGRLVSDNAKFLLSKRIPHVYGDRLDLTVTERVDLGGALIDARKRTGLPVCDQQAIEHDQVTEYEDITELSASGSEPEGGSIFD